MAAGLVTAEQLANMRNTELHEGIFTMHTMPNVHVEYYSFFEQRAKVSQHRTHLSAGVPSRNDSAHLVCFRRASVLHATLVART